MNDTKAILLRLLPYICRQKKLLVLSVFSALLSNLFYVLSPFVIGRAIDAMAGKGQVDFAVIGQAVCILIVLYLFASVFQWNLSSTANRLAVRTVQALRDAAFDRLARAPVKLLDQTSAGDTMSRILNDGEAVNEGIFQALSQLFGGVVTILGALIMMFSLQPLIAAMVLVLTPLCFWISAFIARRSRKMLQKQAQLAGTLNGYAEEIFQNQAVLQAFCGEKNAQAKYGRLNEELYETGRWAQFYPSLVNPATRLVNNTIYILLGITGGFAAVLAGLSVGGISAFLGYAAQFAQPINSITSVSAQLQSALVSARRLFTLMDMPPESASASLPDLPGGPGEVAFSHVSFSYTPDRPLIQDFSLTVPPGSRVAIVGPTGAGKTTLANLLMGFYPLDCGRILLDGTDIAAVSADSLRTRFGMVLQEEQLFAGTIRENIAYARPDASLEDVQAAARKVQAHQFIMRLPQNYDTILHDGGGSLSAGERQLLAIARVMLAQPSLLLLDEATSDIDTLTEKHIQAAFQALMQGRTSFIIAHRLSTIRDADIILVMNHGQVVEKGTHGELLQKGGLYYTLYKNQFENQQEGTG